VIAVGFQDRLLGSQAEPLQACDIEVLQVNLGYRCNMSCSHCHVGAGPERPEVMSGANIDRVIDIIARHEIPTLDITGGSPELHPDFIKLAGEALKIGRHVIVRCNLTVLLEPGMDALLSFYADNSIEIVASLPCYQEENVDSVRGIGTFAKSMEAIKILNRLGYGTSEDGCRMLHLVYNPGGPFLPPAQSSLEADYKKALEMRGISFNRLYTLVNMPIGRFRELLLRTNGLDNYMKRLSDSFNPETLQGVMCRQIVSVAWDGRLFDCDFNQMLDMPIEPPYPGRLEDFDYGMLSQRKIMVGDHCFGCTAGQGSSCGGALD
jgi:radical SAM/Cys-rich protein